MNPMIRGIQRYQNHPYKGRRAPFDTVWSAGTVSLRRIKASAENGQPIVLVPSLINDSSIMDVCEERSLASWLAGQGMDVYLLDWGALCEDPEQNSLSMLINDRLLAAARYVAKHRGRPANALGYCMGGTMLAGAASEDGGAFDKLVFLAAPWNFHVGAQLLTGRVKLWAPQTLPRVMQKGVMPADWLQGLFASLDPDLALRKFSKFDAMDQDSEEAKLFVAVEDWINSGPDIPAGVAEETIQGWFISNKPGENKWIDTNRIENRSLVIASSKDRLVDFESAQALASVLCHATLIDPACGHIGMIAGRGSVADVWMPIADFIALQH